MVTRPSQPCSTGDARPGVRPNINSKFLVACLPSGRTVRVAATPIDNTPGGKSPSRLYFATEAAEVAIAIVIAMPDHGWIMQRKGRRILRRTDPPGRDTGRGQT
ncbi:hypothetical protein CLAIMM_12503 isoform 2 [Cladophialophora immunda]|nr:hypothetical protein CLAIMM_12503 isoform 1 [Cladophialophora immunda]OQV08193.1 hypothetical protein CLAIMM_12503 isoform 2 [Cladophialophora immunda]